MRPPLALLASAVLTALLATAATGQQTAAVFETSVLVVPDDQQRMNALADLDDDDFIDAVGYFWPHSDTFGVFGFQNNGEGRLDPLWQVEFTEYGDNDFPTGLDVRDLNGDGKDDFALVLRDRLRIYITNGANPPTRLHRIGVNGPGNEGVDLVIGDFDGDSQDDIAVLTEQDIQIYTNLLANPTIYTSIPLPGGSGTDLEKIEANGDGIDDLLVAGARLDFYSVSGGQLVQGASFHHGVADPMTAVGDIDNLLGEDVVVFGMDGNYRKLMRTGANSFSLGSPQVGGPATDLADVNDDGFLDGVCCGGGGGPGTFNNNSLTNFEIAINDGGGDFDVSFQLPSLGANHIAGVADVDLDGDVDLVAGRVVFFNVHGFHGKQDVSDGPGPVSNQTLMDADSDGDPDNSLELDRFRRNLGDGNFEDASHIHPPAPFLTTFVGPGFSGDFDGDGDPDLIVEQHLFGHYGTEFQVMRLLKNNGGGGLVDGGEAGAYGTRFNYHADPSMAFAADVTGDGVDDLIAQSGPAFSTVYSKLWVNDGQGFFASGPAFEGEKIHHVGDVDGDQLPDLVSLGDTVYLRRGLGGGLFQAAEALMPVPSSSFPYYPQWNIISAGDYDHDGDTDICAVVPEALGGPAHILENNGLGVFTARTDVLPEYRGYVTAYTADLNGDGLDDLVLGPVWDATAGHALFVQTSRPGLSFEYLGIQVGWITAIADVDGDGDDDALFDRVTFNQSMVPPDDGGRVQYGAATPGDGGQAPTLGAEGPFRFGSSPSMRISGARPGSPGFILAGSARAELANAPRPGVTLSVWPVVALFGLSIPAGVPGEPGSGLLEIPYSVPVEVIGQAVCHQLLLIDPAAPGGVSASNGLEIHYGP